ncbi:MAG TPA: M1 family metallopeptidase [Cyclobacteriaceae bacterium]|nr:M1 family metallopeptidase [Cyclobacteriaceae bacterium]
MRFLYVLILCLLGFSVQAQQNWQGKFEQLGSELPTPNSYRNSAGAPGENYWQQQADYDIEVDLNDETQMITGKETITYHNNSPEILRYLWLQLDQNKLMPGNMTDKTSNNVLRDSVPAKFLAEALGGYGYEYEGGYNIKSVKDATTGKDLPHTINYTMMRVDLPAPLKKGETYKFSVEWSYREYDRMKFDERGGYEYYPEDDNRVYTCAQWFPRMCVFDDYEGWQNKQFLGRGEYALTFGNYKVKITVPSDFIVGATGWLQNPQEVLTKEQQERFARAQKTFDKPVFIVTEAEAKKNEKSRSKKKSTWVYHADNVRDVAFAASRKFIWDAMAVKVGDKTPLAQSLYPKEGNPLWEKESTKAIKNTLEVYSSRTFDYPYPTAYSVHTADQGMEYPMICFNYGRPDKNGYYSQRVLEGMVGVIVHEVGHNFFPMIVNSDERQWTWMDEGLNTFLEHETIRTRYEGFDDTSGTPRGIIPFMKGDKSIMRPIMAQSDNQATSFGPNGYTKPSAALVLLRETIMGNEIFDKAFKEYAERWAFKQPKPADFFRTMEDASGTDLDWFWRGWFYTTDNVDVTLDDVRWFQMKEEQMDPEKKSITVKQGDLTSQNNSGKADDFSSGPQPLTVENTPEDSYRDFRSRINDNAVKQSLKGKNLYELTLKNTGGLISPVIIEWTYKDGSKEIERIPAEIWRLNEIEVKKVFIKDKEVTNVVIDPNRETADVNTSDNIFPKRTSDSKFDKLRQSNK